MMLHQRKESSKVFKISETNEQRKEEEEKEERYRKEKDKRQNNCDHLFSNNLLDKNKFLIALSLRLVSCVITNTYFVPDEYWQSTEVAHRQVFGYGYITWEWKERIRSYLYPFVFEVYFRILHSVSMDTSWLVIMGPHIMQAILTTVADVSVYKLALKINGGDERTARLSYMLNLLSWFIFYTGSRTLSNTAEMCFSCIGLSYFPFVTITSNKEASCDSYLSTSSKNSECYVSNNSQNSSDSYSTKNKNSKCYADKSSESYSTNTNSKNSECNTKDGSINSLWYSLTFGGIACILRPTCLLIWVPLVLLSLYRGVITLGRLAFFKTCLSVVPLLTVLCFGVDFYFYKTLTIVHWNFVQFNIFQNIGVFYGWHPFHWYFSQGIPVVLTFHLVFVLVGMVTHYRGHTMFWIVIVFVLIHSLIPHKEFRFMLPLFPIFMCMAGNGMTTCLRYASKHAILILLLIVNVPVAVYFSTVHQQGTIAVMDFVTNVSQENDSVLFLMPCHSTPYYSYVHKNISMKFLTCEPDQTPGYVCESDVFFSGPMKWLDANIVMDEWSYVAMFDGLAPIIDDYLRGHGFKLVNSIFHTHFPEGHIGNSVNVYGKQ